MKTADVGDCYFVVSNGGRVLATILDKRQTTCENSECEEYYVHYKNCDNRLDSWVKSETIDFQSGVQVNGNTSDIGDERLTRLQKRKKCSEDMQAIDPFKSDHEISKNDILHKPQVKSIACIQFSKYEIDCWYPSRYPEEIFSLMPPAPNTREDKLWICEYCLRYFKNVNYYLMHQRICKIRQPPGKEIYRKGFVSVYEVDGKDDTMYCQNLCLMSKLFLEHKAVYFDVEPFYFYILTVVNREGAHLVGYFSKEKTSLEGNNLACLLVLPPFQKFGFGSFLIALSYELSKLEGLTGKPEKPLSDLGLASYKKYWCVTLLKTIKLYGTNISIKDLSKLTGITQEDILNTLKDMNMAKYWKCKHVICVSIKQIEDALEKMQETSLRKQNRERNTHKMQQNMALVDFVFDPSRISWKFSSSPVLNNPSNQCSTSVVHGNAINSNKTTNPNTLNTNSHVSMTSSAFIVPI